MRSKQSPDYRPSEDEEFMNPVQLEYFRQKLLRWRAELLAESTETLQHLKEECLSEPGTASGSSSRRSTRRYSELKIRATAIARKPASPSASADSKRAPLRP